MVDGQKKNMKSCLRKAAQAWNYRDWNRERREAELREKEERERSIEEWQAKVESQGFERYPCVPRGPPRSEGNFVYACSSRCPRSSPAE